MTIEKAISRAPEATWVLVNPLLEDTIDSYTFGLPPSSRSLPLSLARSLFKYAEGMLSFHLEDEGRVCGGGAACACEFQVYLP
jgi:hypothetical protein